MPSLDPPSIDRIPSSINAIYALNAILYHLQIATWHQYKKLIHLLEWHCIPSSSCVQLASGDLSLNRCFAASSSRQRMSVIRTDRLRGDVSGPPAQTRRAGRVVNRERLFRRVGGEVRQLPGRGLDMLVLLAALVTALFALVYAFPSQQSSR